METEKLYWKDAYLKQFSARILKIENNSIILDKTAFYPTGGGQPNDTGKLVHNGKEYKVIDVSKRGDAIVHIVEEPLGLEEGMEITGEIDWKRRYMHMRYHTALHILDGVANKEGKGRITGGQIYTDKARIDFDAEAMDRNLVQQIIDDAQKVIEEDHKVVPRFLSKEEALSIKDLSRTDPGNELLKTLDTIRVIDIVGFDMQLDGGTHVASTKEVGKINMAKYESKGAHNKRITITLE